MKSKVSLISTVLNEEDNIKEFIESILKQTKIPDEFIIVDGGSTDRTYKILRDYSEKYGWIKVYQVKGASIGKGRNFAIEKAKNEIIAVTDAGCLIDEKWLEEITKPLIEGRAEVVVGNYLPWYRNDFEYILGKVIIKDGSKLSPSRASSRSIAFLKKCWKKIGGYPENFSFGEDTNFNLKIFPKFKIAYAPNAIVYWKMRPTIKEVFKQFYRYGRGDRAYGNLFKMKKNLIFILGFWISLFFFFFLLIINMKFIVLYLLIFIFFYLILGIYGSIKAKKIKAKFIMYYPLFWLIKRISYILGASIP